MWVFIVGFIFIGAGGTALDHAVSKQFGDRYGDMIYGGFFLIFGMLIVLKYIFRYADEIFKRKENSRDR